MLACSLYRRGQSAPTRVLSCFMPHRLKNHICQNYEDNIIDRLDM